MVKLKLCFGELPEGLLELLSELDYKVRFDVLGNEELLVFEDEKMGISSFYFSFC